MREQQNEQENAKLLQEYREVIRDVRKALDDMEKEIEGELCPDQTDTGE